MTRVNKPTTTDRIPLSLDGRGIKGEGEDDASASFYGYCLKASMTDPFCPIDSRLHGNDDRFCKGLHDGRGIKGLSQCLTRGQRVKTMLMHRHVIADLIRNPEGQW